MNCVLAFKLSLRKILIAVCKREENGFLIASFNLYRILRYCQYKSWIAAAVSARFTEKGSGYSVIINIRENTKREKERCCQPNFSQCRLNCLSADFSTLHLNFFANNFNRHVISVKADNALLTPLIIRCHST